MTGPLPCDHCRGVHFCVYIRGTGAKTLILECSGCGARTGFRASGPVMVAASTATGVPANGVIAHHQ